MRSTTLIVPGLHGSGPGHWQTWFESQLDGAQRVTQDDWGTAAIHVWAERIRQSIDAAVGKVWLVAHSFGCLASVVAAADRSDRVAGALLVAPANPERFGLAGLHPELGGATAATSERAPITPVIPHRELAFPSVVVASVNDPWMRLTAASVWADRWGSQFECIGSAGHINVDSGFGPWPQGLKLFRRFVATHGNEPLGDLGNLSATGGPRNEPRAEPANGHLLRGERMLRQQWFG